MKKTIKKLLSILSLVVLMLTFSCTEDLYKDETHTNENQNFIIKRVNFTDISTNKKLVEKLGKLNNKKEATVNTEGKIVFSSEYGFYVDTDYANYIEDENGKHSYIFKVYRDSVQNKLDNIVFSSQEDNSYKVVLISYDLTSLEQQNLENGISINVSDNPRAVNLIDDENLTNDIFNKTLIVYEGNGCITIMETSCSYGNTKHPDGFHDGVNCPGYTETVWWTDCGDSGGGGTSGGYNNPTGNTGSTTTGTSGSSSTGGGGGSSNNTSSNSNDTIYTTPTYPSPQQILKDKFIKQLSGGFLNPNNPKDCFNNLPQEQKDEILDAVGSLAIQLNENGTSQNSCGNSTTEEEQFNEIEEVMTAMCGNPDMDFDVAKSLKSPANIDFSAIDTNTPEGQKFNCIYNKLLYSCNFENLFVNTFGGTQTKLNVKFEIADNLPDDVNGNCRLLPSNNGNYTNLIRINSKILNGADVQSNFRIAKTILHECIHAYLNIKKINCNLGTTITELNGLDLQSLIGTFYQGFGCHIDVNGSAQSQHDFIFTFLIPAFQNVFSEIRDILVTQSNINYVNGLSYTNSINNQSFTWNWNDFYKYFSMTGLHLCDSFIQEIQNVPIENFYYNFYKDESQNFTKNCQ